MIGTMAHFPPSERQKGRLSGRKQHTVRPFNHAAGVLFEQDQDLVIRECTNVLSRDCGKATLGGFSWCYDNGLSFGRLNSHHHVFGFTVLDNVPLRVDLELNRPLAWYLFTMFLKRRSRLNSGQPEFASLEAFHKVEQQLVPSFSKLVPKTTKILRWRGHRLASVGRPSQVWVAEPCELLRREILLAKPDVLNTFRKAKLQKRISDGELSKGLAALVQRTRLQKRRLYLHSRLFGRRSYSLRAGWTSAL